MELNAVLHIDQLNFEFTSHPLFRHFSLRLGTGITWLRGENGAGKTTLLKLAGGALTPSAAPINSKVCWMPTTSSPRQNGSQNS